jgi:hypothetical protein
LNAKNFFALMYIGASMGFTTMVNESMLVCASMGFATMGESMLVVCA